MNKLEDKKTRLPRSPLAWLGLIVLGLWCAFSIFALLWIGVSSLKTNKEFFSSPWKLFSQAQWGNYENVWKGYKLGSYFLNSLFVVLVSDFIILCLIAPAAYVISRVKMKAVQIIGKVIVFGMGIPVQLLVIPLYFQLNDMHLRDSLTGLILVYAAVQLPISCFLIQSFFRTAPHELEEAALIDGCTPIGGFFRVMLPLGRPGIATAGILNFITLWNEFILCYTFLESSSKFTLSVGLYSLNASMQYSGEWTTLMAGFVVVIIPTLVVYLLMSKQIIAGLSMGAVKG